MLIWTKEVKEEDRLTEKEIKILLEGPSFFVDPNPDWEMTEEELREAVGDAAVDYALNM